MSKTDKTTPWKVVERRGECGHGRCMAGYPCHHFSITKTLDRYRYKLNRQARARMRDALSKGREPEPYRPRHRAHWDAT
jgi:hypothetical protein